VKLPEHIDDGYLSESGKGKQPHNIQSQMECFSYSVGLFEILNDVMLTLYTPANYDDEDYISQLQITKILDLNSRLDRFIGNMPSHLQAKPFQGSKRLQIQAKALHSRYVVSIVVGILLIASGPCTYEFSCFDLVCLAEFNQ
jgi:hypothetical protein